MLTGDNDCCPDGREPDVCVGGGDRPGVTYPVRNTGRNKMECESTHSTQPREAVLPVMNLGSRGNIPKTQTCMQMTCGNNDRELKCARTIS